MYNDKIIRHPVQYGHLQIGLDCLRAVWNTAYTYMDIFCNNKLIIISILLNFVRRALQPSAARLPKPEDAGPGPDRGPPYSLDHVREPLGPTTSTAGSVPSHGTEPSNLEASSTAPSGPGIHLCYHNERCQAQARWSERQTPL